MNLHSLVSRRCLAPLALAASTLLAACGGGGGGDGASDPPAASPASYTTGRITGFGSVIVGGVRFDDTSARITDDDGDERSRDELRLGMVVEVQAGRIDDRTASGAASRIVVRSEVRGPVEAVDVAAGTLTVLGQAVKVDAATVFEDTRGLAALAVGTVVEVHAVASAGGTRLATRIEAKRDVDAYKLRGTVSALDTVAKTFRIGGALIAYAGVVDLPALANGSVVKVRLATAPVAGAWVATRIRTGEREIEVADRDEAEVEGAVSGVVGLADFKVAGVRVDASGAGVVFERGTAADVVDGARVEVEGRLVDGVLVATLVKIEDGDDDERGVELHGAVESVDAAAKSFVLRGVRVAWTATTRFDGIAVADLVVGARIEVKGQLAAGGGIVADEIETDD